MKKILGWVAVGIIVLTIIGAVAGGGDKSDDKPAAAPTTTTTAATTAKPDPPDTGRMSSGEYDDLLGVTSRYRQEVADFGERLGGKCATLASVGELAALSDCVNDAYDGVEDTYIAADVTYTELIDATAKTCKVRVTTLERRLRQMQGTLEAVHKSAENLQLTGATANVAGRYLRARSARFMSDYRRARASCLPT